MADETPVETFDATDTAAEDNARREVARHERMDADAIRYVMHRPSGRAWFYRLLTDCHIFGAGRVGPVAGTSFVPGSSDVTFYQLGEENIGKRLMMEAMNASPDLYLLMIKEQRDDGKRLDEVRRKERINREREDAPVNPQDFTPDLPPPAGFPGGPKLAKKK